MVVIINLLGYRCKIVCLSTSNTSIRVEVTAVANSPTYYATELIATKKVLLRCIVSWRVCHCSKWKCRRLTNLFSYYASRVNYSHKTFYSACPCRMFVTAVTSTLLEVSQIDKPILLLCQLN